MSFDDKKVVYESSTERIVHVHRNNIVANIEGEWTRPTILVAAEGQTPVFSHEVEVYGRMRVVERPPGVHMVVDDAATITARDAAGEEIDLPDWALPPVLGEEVDVIRVSVDEHRRLQDTLEQTADRLTEAGLPTDASVLRQAATRLGRVRRALASHADRFLTKTQPIDLPVLQPQATDE